MVREVPPQCWLEDCEKPLAKRPWGEYCDDHTCQFEGCGRERDFGENARYCDKHTCRDWICTNLALPREDFCNEHTGRICDCSRCGNPKQASGESRYCERHTCAKDSCYKLIRFLNKGDLFCVDHSCRANLVCTKEATIAGGFCEEHECKTLGCHTRSTVFTYCASHKCRTESKNCHGHVARVYVDFCEGHICQSSDGCRDEREGDWYCSCHICLDPDCEEETVWSWTEYCYDHACNWSGPGVHDLCLNKRVEGTRACEEHKCKESRCINEQVSDGEYCKDHTCKKSG